MEKKARPPGIFSTSHHSSTEINDYLKVRNLSNVESISTTVEERLYLPTTTSTQGTTMVSDGTGRLYWGDVMLASKSAFLEKSVAQCTGVGTGVSDSYVTLGDAYLDGVKYVQRLRNVQGPELDDDVATKKYVDLLASTGLSFLQPVKVTTTGQLSVLSGLGVVDGIQLQAGDRVLVKNGTDANPGVLSSDNGIYVAQSGVWSRSVDAGVGVSSNKVTVQAERGDTFVGDLFSCTTNTTFGNPVEFQQIAFIGNIDGPNSSTDNAVARWDGLSGRVLQNSSTTVSDSGLLTTADVLATTSIAVQNGSARKTSLIASGLSTSDTVLTLPAELPSGSSYVTLDSGGVMGTQRYNKSLVDPTVSDDASGGYQSGSVWINETNDTSFVCVDSSVGSAVWKQTSNTQSGGDVFEEFVLVSTTAEIGLSGVGYNIDGIPIVEGSRILVKDQSNSTQNGIYIAHSGAWTRALDAQVGTSALGKGYWVANGTSSAGVVYYVNSGDNFGDSLGFLGFLRTVRPYQGSTPPLAGTLVRFALDSTGNHITGTNINVNDLGDISNVYQLGLRSSGVANGTINLRHANNGYDYTFRFPSSLGTNGGYLLADGGGNSSWLRQAFNFGGNPSSSDNQSSGFYSGSLWTNNIANTAYICTSSSNVSATWKEITVGGDTSTRYDAIVEVNDIGTGSSATIIRSGGLISSLSKGNSTDGSYLTSVVRMNFSASLGTNYVCHVTLVDGAVGPVPGGIVQVSAINTNYIDVFIRRDPSIVSFIGTRLHVSIIL